MAVPFDILASDEFKRSWQRISFELGPQAAEFDESVLRTVRLLYERGPGFGMSREDAIYSVPITKDYELAYEWLTERDEHGNATINHLSLLPIEHTR